MSTVQKIRHGNCRLIAILIRFLLILLLLTGVSCEKEKNKDEETLQQLLIADFITQGAILGIFTPTTVADPGNPDVLFESRTGTFTLDLDVPSTKDVYFVFTNKSSSTGSSPVVSRRIVQDGEEVWSLAPRATPGVVPAGEKIRPVSLPQRALRGKPSVSRFNETPPDFGRKSTLTKLFGSDQIIKSNSYAINDTATFYTDNTTGSGVTATLRSTTTDGTHSLYVWVDNNSWSGCSLKACVTQTMVDALAPKFLQSGSGNDIYDWVTSILGDEWGTTDYTNLIGDDNTIHILLTDIDNDNSQTGGVIGFFYSKDNFKVSSDAPGSNQKIMFYLDSVMFATPDSGSTWAITQKWPEEAISTLAHEFQHMIHFYQRNVKLGVYPQTWVNEMASMSVEDLVARKLGVNGPRGVDSETATAGSAGNTSGYLPLFVGYAEEPVAAWGGSIIDYSVKYAFGAYLMRNCGGADFINRLVIGDSSTGTAAVESAMAGSTGCSEWKFLDIMRRWGGSVLLSDRSGLAVPYAYNTGTWSDSTRNGITYSLGSINMYNYKYEGNSFSTTGPYIWTTMPSSLRPTSNTYYLAASSVSGKQTFQVTLPTDVYLTIVYK